MSPQATDPKADGILAESVPETTGVLPVVKGPARPLGTDVPHVSEDPRAD